MTHSHKHTYPPQIIIQSLVYTELTEETWTKKAENRNLKLLAHQL